MSSPASIPRYSLCLLLDCGTLKRHKGIIFVFFKWKYEVSDNVASTAQKKEHDYNIYVVYIM